MSVQNGQPVNAAVTNAAFVSKLVDSDTVGKVGLKNTDGANSGDFIDNAQAAINKAFEGVGATGETDTTINNYSSANYISNGDNRKVAIGKLDTQLLATQTQLAALDAINSQDVTVGAIGSTPNANALTLSGQVLNVEPASASFGGVVTTGTQTFAGNKTFANDVTVSGNQTITGDLTVNGTTTTINSVNTDILDANITLNKNGNDATSEGSGFTTDRTGTKGSLIFANAAASKYKIGSLGSEVEIATISHTQTLTNKTLTSPVINTPTGITKSDVGLSNVDNTSDSTKNSATATLTNKSISGSTNTLTNIPLSSAVTGTLPIANGGTGQTTQTAAFDALSPISAKGDLIVNNGTNDVALAVGTNAFVLTADSTTATGLKWAASSAASLTNPTVQRFTTGSGTYTRPSSPTPIYLKVTVVSAGGGGGGSGAGAGTGGTGGTSSFGTSLLTVTGGVGGSGAGAGGSGGGNVTVNAPAITLVSSAGANGASGTQLVTSTGGVGSPSIFGGGGAGGQGNSGAGGSAVVRGAGGGGAGGTAAANSAGAGQAGGAIVAIITSPSATYPYAVGAAASGGTAGTGGGGGGASIEGIVIVEEYYQ